MESPIKGKEITIDMRKVAVFELADSIEFRFLKNEGTAVIVTYVKVSKEIARAAVQLVNDIFGDFIPQKTFDSLRFQYHAEEEREKKDFIERVKQCEKENPEAYKLVKMFGEGPVSRATLFSALTDFAKASVRKSTKAKH